MRAFLLVMALTLTLASIAQSTGAQQATRLRLISLRHETFTAGTWGYTDTTRYIYNNPNAGYKPASDRFVYDTSAHYQFDGSIWAVSSKAQYTYNADGFQLEYSSYSGGALTPGYREVWAYNAANKRTSVIAYQWDGSIYNNYLQLIYTYDANNNMLTSLEQDWIAGAWQNNGQNILTYNSNNKVVSNTSQDWIAGTWTNVGRTTSSYNTNGTLDNTLSQAWSGGAWVNQSMSEYTYDPSDRVEIINGSNWSGTAWVSASRAAFTYDAGGNKSNVTSYTYSGSAYVPTYRTLYTYTPAGKTATETSQTYTAGTWVNNNLISIEYNAEGHTTSYMRENWVAGAWQGNTRNLLTYEEYEELTSAVDAPLTITSGIYPNPFIQNTLLALQNPVAGNVTISVADITGKLIKTQTGYMPKGTQSLMIDGAEWPAGMYFLRISSGGYNGTVKLIKQ